MTFSSRQILQNMSLLYQTLLRKYLTKNLISLAVLRIKGLSKCVCNNAFCSFNLFLIFSCIHVLFRKTGCRALKDLKLYRIKKGFKYCSLQIAQTCFSDFKRRSPKKNQVLEMQPNRPQKEDFVSVAVEKLKNVLCKQHLVNI